MSRRRPRVPVGHATWSGEQHALLETVADFAARELEPRRAERAATGRIDRDAWRACAQIGVQGLVVPEEFGGSACDATTTVAALEGLGYGTSDNGLIFSLGAHLWAVVTPLARFGSPVQHARWLPGLADGTLVGAHGMSEPASGSDAFALTTTATRDGDDWVLHGQKTFVTNGPDADVIVVFATMDRAQGFAGLCAFVLDRATPGLTVGPPFAKMGLASSPMSELFLDDCRVGPDALLGEAGGGMAVFNHSMRWERGLILAPVIGTLRRQLERTLDYAKERRQFDAPIGSFQAVAHRIVQMRLRYETARLMVYELARKIDAGEPVDVEASLTKLHVSECFVQSSTDALQIHGGYGYMSETGIEHEIRDALGSRIYSGTSDIQANLVARHLGL